MYSQRFSAAYTLLIFVFFIAGGMVLSFLYADFPDLKQPAFSISSIGMLFAPLVLSLFLAMTVYGVFLMPLCSFACGAIIACLAENVLSAGSNYSDYRDALAFLCILVPAFFVVCSGGMYTSSLVRESVAKAKPAIKGSFRSYILAALISVTVVAAAGYLIHKM